MSVQAGIWNFDGAPVDRASLERISALTAQYGPDGAAIRTDGNIGMLYRPFHTTAESRLERQPLVFGNGRVMTWDGRLDNRGELISEIRDPLNAQSADATIVAAAFERWGHDSFAKLIGDWALSIWDPSTRVLTLSRDYIGIKQLFYYPARNAVVWCSHLAPLVLCGDTFTLSDEYVAGFLAFYPDAHVTPYCEIQSVPPGQFVCIYYDKQIKPHTYWALNQRGRLRYKKDKEYEEHYRQVFGQAIRRRLRTDSPILAELSGGLDSSSIVCIADNIVNESPGARTLDTFSFHDSNEPEGDDLTYFTKVEKKRGKTGFHVDLSGAGDSFAFGYTKFLPIPGLGGRAGVKAALSQVVQSGGYRIILSGHGGDEMNGQTLDPRIQMAELLLQLRFCELGRQLIAWSLLIRKRPWIQLLLQTLAQLIPVPVKATVTEYSTRVPWINPDFARKHGISARLLERVEGVWFGRPGHIDAMRTIGTLSRKITNSQPSPIEKRFPYLDRDFVEFVTALPLDQLLRPGQRRFLMRRALANILPPEIANRKVKAQVSRFPCIALTDNWNEVERCFSSSSSSTHRGYIEEQKIRNALSAARNGQLPRYVLRLFNAVSLELWLRDMEARGVISGHSTGSRPLPCGGNIDSEALLRLPDYRGL